MIRLMNVVIACALTLPAFASAHADTARQDMTVEQMRNMSQLELNETYLGRVAGPMPDGESHGTAVFFPGSIINSPTQILAGLIWQGKVFDTTDGVLVNKVFGFDAIKAEIFYGPSLFDGQNAIIIDYRNTSILANRIRDEIRQVGPNLYLGRAYLRGIFFDYMVVNFILDFNH